MPITSIGLTTSQSSLTILPTSMPAVANNNPNFMIRFGIASNKNTDYFWIDDIFIQGTSD